MLVRIQMIFTCPNASHQQKSHLLATAHVCPRAVPGAVSGEAGRDAGLQPQQSPHNEAQQHADAQLLVEKQQLPTPRSRTAHVAVAQKTGTKMEPW